MHKYEFLGSKDGQMFTNLKKKLHLQIVVEFQNNVPQSKDFEYLIICKCVMSSESWESVENASDLRALRRHCFKNRLEPGMEISARAQEHTHKSFSAL